MHAPSAWGESPGVRLSEHSHSATTLLCATVRALGLDFQRLHGVVVRCIRSGDVSGTLRAEHILRFDVDTWSVGTSKSGLRYRMPASSAAVWRLLLCWQNVVDAGTWWCAIIESRAPRWPMAAQLCCCLRFMRLQGRIRDGTACNALWIIAPLVVAWSASMCCVPTQVTLGHVGTR